MEWGQAPVLGVTLALHLLMTEMYWNGMLLYPFGNSPSIQSGTTTTFQSSSQVVVQITAMQCVARPTGGVDSMSHPYLYVALK